MNFSGGRIAMQQRGLVGHDRLESGSGPSRRAVRRTNARQSVGYTMKKDFPPAGRNCLGTNQRLASIHSRLYDSIRVIFGAAGWHGRCNPHTYMLALKREGQWIEL